MLGNSRSRLKALLISSVPHISKTTPLSLASSSSSSKSFSFSPPTLFQNPNILLPKPNIFLPKSSISSAQNIRCVQMEAESHQRSGEIHVIVGPMFAGKTTTLLRKVQSERGDGRYSSFQVKPPKHVQLDKTLKGLCYSGRLAEAVALLCRTGLEFNPATYALLLQECIFRKEYKKGKRIHAHMIVVGFVLNEYLKTKLLILYAKSGDLRTAHILLDMLLEKSLVSWNAIIAGYVQKGLEDVGLSLYNKMRQRGLIPDQYTFASVFRACASLATLEHGKQAHGVMIKCQIGQNVVVSSALMDMYFKCSDISDGHRVFDTSQNRNAITWTALISGYGQHGRVVEVLNLFHRMKSEGFRPNYVTFISVLSACGHGALVDKAWECFSSMTRDYGIRPRAQHYAALVDVLGRVGRLEEAYEFVSNSPYKEHSVIWGAFLWACRIHGDRDLLKLAAKKYFTLEPENAGKYVVLSNAYATFGLWDNVAEVRDMMKESGIVKEPAYSKIEVQKELDVIGIDEAQFFEDLYDFCSEAADRDGKKVIVAGLDGDYLRRKFGSVLDVVPLADSVTKLTARCELCGKRAFFTLRKTEEMQTELIGGADVYMPVCRQHYVAGQVAIEAARVVLESQVQCGSYA
ncbi:hypothetical protein C1H46_011880 [Malus baccata]|uniref:thymidine kinase n=1 Tax=Malus baccata TaxID=106549 RepID=A0A540MUM7_MALBA|nr:hypothetical protein C1H46_011880 [Malus baccata]